MIPLLMALPPVKTYNLDLNSQGEPNPKLPTTLPHLGHGLLNL
jgi:hypothetical protein